MFKNFFQNKNFSLPTYPNFLDLVTGNTVFFSFWPSHKRKEETNASILYTAIFYKTCHNSNWCPVWPQSSGNIITKQPHELPVKRQTNQHDLTCKIQHNQPCLVCVTVNIEGTDIGQSAV